MSGDGLTLDDVMRAVEKLRAANVPTFHYNPHDPRYYIVAVHPRWLVLLKRARYGGKKGRSADRKLRRAGFWLALEGLGAWPRRQR